VMYRSSSDCRRLRRRQWTSRCHDGGTDGGHLWARKAVVRRERRTRTNRRTATAHVLNWRASTQHPTADTPALVLVSGLRADAFFRRVRCRSVSHGSAVSGLSWRGHAGEVCVRFKAVCCRAASWHRERTASVTPRGVLAPPQSCCGAAQTRCWADTAPEVGTAERVASVYMLYLHCHSVYVSTPGAEPIPLFGSMKWPL